ncbi:uncharacterized protein PHALS_11591 [Plasmopara halstedii]|uniref:Uncharacterized protein n=1 Tax=Plasmopara halstedii TaxID=4781 RepID=A0A0P1AK33_PLAHL|nr:uncharacterized protein PHALS_11591 [Plasmopara halstedii]CEG41230.1 hypothetical protein PHALS_11591 [Plasmopara halstedii]|eukprot:XP_024577599.1 hypothetical protein PHALS_11591 [Plasmopara halstedii]
MGPVSTTLKSPSLAGYDSEHGQSPTSSPARGAMSDSASAASRDVQPRLDEHERRALRTLSVTSDLVGDVEVVDYESDTRFPAWDDKEGEPRKRCGTSPARALRTSCPFPDLSSTEERGVITNDLDGAQRRQLEAARKAALMRAYPRPVIDPHVEYGFRPADPVAEVKNAVSRPLRHYIIGLLAITEDELVERFAEVAPQDFTSSRSRGIPATSQDIGFDFVDDVDPQVVPHDSGHHRSRQEELALDNDDLVDRRPVTRDGLRAHADKVRRHRDFAEHHVEVAYRCVEDLKSLDHVVHQLSHVKDYRALSERLLAVEQANASLRATVEHPAPLETEFVAHRAQSQLQAQLMGDQAPLGASPAPTLPRSLAPDSGTA